MLSAVILSHNDQKALQKCLDSLSFCDERVVIDDESTSLHVKNATIFKRPLHGDFAAQRNFGLEKAKGEWVLFVDSDELVTTALANEIKKAITIDCAGFYITRQDFLFGKKLSYGETARVKLLRLAKKNAGYWIRPVHEVWNVKGSTGVLNNSLHHFPHPNVAQFISDINMYSTLNARFLFNEKIEAPWWHVLAYPVAKFFVDYLWYLGFLDGTRGAIVAIMMSMHSFLTRAKLWLLWQKNTKTS